MMTPEQVLELLDTNRKILATNKEILTEVRQVRDITKELTEAKMLKRHQERDRQKKKREAERAKKLEGRLETSSAIWRKDARLQEKGTYRRWACIGIRMGLQGRTDSFLRYLMYDWNNNLFTAKPITKTNGGLHIYMGKGTCRQESTVGNVFGSERSFNPRTVGEATIFEWGYHMATVLAAMEKMPAFADLPGDFVQCIQFVCGGYADMCETGLLNIKGHDWDPADAPELMPKVAEFRSLYLRTMRALKNGLMARDWAHYSAEHGLDDIICHGEEDYDVLVQLDVDIKESRRRESAKASFLERLHSQRVEVDKAAIIGSIVAAAHEEKQIQHAIEMSLEVQQPEERPLGGNDDEKTV
jgi:hypothetical protein